MDYKPNYVSQLKQQPRVMIATAKANPNKARELSPGPHDYSPNKDFLKKRNRTIIFETAKRNQKPREVSPGPGQYYLPIRGILDRPSFMLKGQSLNLFRYV